MLRIAFLAILLLTGCENNKQVEQDQVVDTRIQQIESPLQNTAEGIAKAKAKRSIVNNIR
jgi:outer membrane biogenesis lipoprotein LolB